MFSSIVVGVDGSPSAREALKHAIGLAKRHKAKLHLINVYRGAAQLAAHMALSGGIGTVSGELEDQLRADADEILRGAAAEAEASKVPVDVHAVAGDASEAIIDLAEHLGADLIIVGNRGMSGVRRVLGSVPNSVAHHAACSVMIVRTT